MTLTTIIMIATTASMAIQVAEGIQRMIEIRRQRGDRFGKIEEKLQDIEAAVVTLMRKKRKRRKKKPVDVQS
jgi:hypothetical protein